MIEELLNHPRNKHIDFVEDSHEYFYYPSGDKRKSKEKIKYSGITGWISSYKLEKFNAQKVAKSANSNPRSEYYNWGVDKILEFWKQNRDDGTAIHKVIEESVNFGLYDEDFGVYIDAFWNEMDKIGVEPVKSEFVVYDEDIQRATPIDVIGTRHGTIVPLDIKTFRKGMTFTGYQNKSLKHPLTELQDSKFTSVSLQVSIARKWLIEKYGVPEERIDDGYVVVLNDDGIESFPVLDYGKYVNKMYEYK